MRRGLMPIDTADVIGRSDIVLLRPNRVAQEAMPLGNGRLGVAVWSEDGLTAQLNRADTMPYRYSTGQVVIPGLAKLTSASDYVGRLNLYDGEFVERGGGMSAAVYVQPDSDTLIIDVSGADPAKEQTAVLRLWEPRQATASVEGNTGMLAESWLDDQQPGASGRRFGSLSAITAEGRIVSAAVTTPESVTVTVMPNAAGHFRIVVGSPHYSGEMVGAHDLAMKALAERSVGLHSDWWNNFWHQAGIIKVSSRDGSGEYMENLRTLYLFTSAAENGGEFPGSQAGVADLFSAGKDFHQWDPAAFWHWNLRMQVGANLGAGLPELNAPYFRLYRENLAAMETWTKERMGGRPGICVPETMRFNGQGIEFETWGGNTKTVTGWNCDAASGPYYNARTISTGAEVSQWIWRQYLATDDRTFLAENFPVMAAAARFLLAYEKPGADGLLHTSPSNAHEMQWDVTDPTTDLSARQVLYSATIEAASILHEEPALVEQLRADLGKIPQFPRVDAKTPTVLLAGTDDGHGDDVIATSYLPGDTFRNVENIGLEPVWPYGLIGDTSPLFALAKRTFYARRYKSNIDWSFDPVQAARLGLGDDVRNTLVTITEANQQYVNGFAKWAGTSKEFYVEQIGMVALGLQEALAQDYDGTIRIAPAIPKGWDFDGSVALRHGVWADVQVRGGVPLAVGLEVKSAQVIHVKNPWLGEAVSVRNAMTGQYVVRDSAEPIVHFSAKAGSAYLLERGAGKMKNPFVTVDGVRATTFKSLGPVQIGLGPEALQSH
jgi:alpha-L-fucosidase 2